MIEFKYIKKAKDLPKDWDKISDSYFQSIEFLSHVERYNYCNQRYYMVYNENKLASAAIMYSLHLDLFTFLRIKSPIKTNIVGIPASVSFKGIFGKQEYIEALKNHIYKENKGLILFLNLEAQNKNSDKASGKTLPTIIFKNQFINTEEYKSKLRYPYRRRINKLNSNTNYNIVSSNCSVFDEEMHKQYLAVYNKSNDKLERLNLDFFKNLPDNFLLTTIKKKDSLLGWYITLTIKAKTYFFLGGIDYKLNKDNSTYLRLLHNIVEKSIKDKTKTIDLGQTAEIPKIRMGGKPKTLYMEVFHSNYIFNYLLKKIITHIEYKVKLEYNKVFKEDLD